MWDWRTRLFPLRMDTRAGLKMVAELHAPVDLIYIDADHTHAGALGDLRAVTELFPEALLSGDDWQWPGVHRTKGRQVHEAFNESRERASKESFKAGASEMLQLYPLVLRFAESIIEPTGKLWAEIASLRR